MCLIVCDRMWPARCGPSYGSAYSASVSNFLLEVRFLPPQLAEICFYLPESLCRAVLQYQCEINFSAFGSSRGGELGLIPHRLRDIRGVCGVEDLSIQMETVRMYAPRWNFHMYRMQQLEKEIEEIQAEILEQEARLAEKDVLKNPHQTL